VLPLRARCRSLLFVEELPSTNDFIARFAGAASAAEGLEQNVCHEGAIDALLRLLGSV
jgi:hypothetical protein